MPERRSLGTRPESAPVPPPGNLESSSRGAIAGTGRGLRSDDTTPREASEGEGEVFLSFSNDSG